MAEARERGKVAGEGGGRVNVTARVAAAMSEWARLCFGKRRGRLTKAGMVVDCEFVIMAYYDIILFGPHSCRVALTAHSVDRASCACRHLVFTVVAGV